MRLDRIRLVRSQRASEVILQVFKERDVRRHYLLDVKILNHEGEGDAALREFDGQKQA